MNVISLMKSAAHHLTGVTWSFRDRDLTAANRELITAAAAAELQKDLDAKREPHSRVFTVRLADGRWVKVKGVSAGDAVITDGKNFLMIQKKGSNRFLHPGGMKDVVDGRIESAIKTAIREGWEETGYVLQPDALSKAEVMGVPRVNPRDIRFYDPLHDKDGKLAKDYGLKPGDAFIIDMVGVKFPVSRDLSTLEILKKGTPLMFKQEPLQARGDLARAGDDAASVHVIPAEQAALLAMQGRISPRHYEMMHNALPAIVPPPEALEDHASLHPARRLMPILNQALMAQIVHDDPEAVAVIKKGLVPIVQPALERLKKIAAGRTIVGIGYVNNQGNEKLIQGEPYAAAINPALDGKGPAARVVFNANGMKDREAFSRNYDISRPEPYTYEEAMKLGLIVQGDMTTVTSVLTDRAFLHVRNANGAEEKIPLATSDFVIGWRQTRVDNERRIIRIPEGYTALFPKPDWTSVDRLVPLSALVANGPADGYCDEPGLNDRRLSLLVRAGDGTRVPDLADQGKIPTLSSKTLAQMAYSASDLRTLPESQSDEDKKARGPVTTKTLIRSAIAKLPNPDKEAVCNWLDLMGAQDFAAEMGLSPVSALSAAPPVSRLARA